MCKMHMAHFSMHATRRLGCYTDRRGMAAMKRPWQFSLGYLLLEMVWISLAVGFASHAVRVPPSPDANLYRSMFILPAIVFAAAAIGGLLGRMDGGFYAAYGLLAIGLLATIILSCLFMFFP